MRRQDILIIAAAVVSGIIVFIIAANLLGNSAKQKFSFAIANKPIVQDTVITADDVTLSGPLSNVTQQQLDGLYLQPKDVVGFQAIEEIPKGEFIYRSKVKQPSLNPDGSTEVDIPAGKRTLTLSASEIENVPYDLKSGSFVDVIGNMATFDGGTEQQPIVRDVLVRYVMRNEQSAVDSVTLVLNPRATDAVVRASKRGKLRFSVRSDGTGDETIVSEYIGYIEIVKGVSKEKVSIDRSSYYQEDTAVDKVNPLRK